MRYAEVAVNAAVQGTFHYHIPEALDDSLRPGHLVRVSFGTAMQPGVVVALHDSLPSELETIKTKPIGDLLDQAPVMTPQHIALGLWMSEQYLSSPGSCLWLMLPPGLVGSSTQLVHLRDADALGHNDTEAEILDALRANAPEPLYIKQLKPIAAVKMLKPILRKMAQRGLINVQPMLSPPTAKPKTVRTIMRTMPKDEVTANLNMLKRAPKQQAIFQQVSKHDYPVDVDDLHHALPDYSRSAFLGGLNALEKREMVSFSERVVYRDSLTDRDYVPSQPPPLAEGQREVWEQLHPTLVEGRYGAFLLHGVTGSGKTEIYLRAIDEVLQQGRQAIFLVPEIALTPQTIRRVSERFPAAGAVAVVHGSLSVGERYDTWQRARAGEIQVVVGARSALFTPLPDVGLIILDEEHDQSYKQSPPIQPPYYQAREVAERLAKLNDAVLILGSATPDLGSTFRAQQGDVRYLHLPDRIMGHQERLKPQAQRHHIQTAYRPLEGAALTKELPPVSVVDMREELKAGHRSMFSRLLLEKLAGVIERDEQAILFLNRRGQATYIFCRDCGYVAQCQRCDTPLTYHRYGEMLRCHHCAHQQPNLTDCPECGSKRIKHFGAGTQQVEEAFRQLYPDIAVARWDSDTASKPELHERILADFAALKIQVMVGTQMIAKGLDLPMVTLVGVVSADPGLALPDFRAGERGFQLLAQVAGRAGRSQLPSEVVLQTYQPEHPSIVAAAQHDYERFYAHEMAWRREAGYPPYRRLGRVLVQNAHPIEAERSIRHIADQVQRHIEKRQLTDTQLIGPAPCFFSRIDNNYRWQLLVRSADPSAALAGLQIRPGWYIDIDPVDIL